MTNRYDRIDRILDVAELVFHAIFFGGGALVILALAVFAAVQN